MQSEIILSWRF